ncbi:isoaspartyl peptidase/L-asparaginase family protein [Xanthovirga aplysinae]|uniref:isoaspartyl peptidase/L-asparaginase family protein n=1 Tax=Xanthovirga aplysinae TaxID=2529853 RepID=UPI0012BC64E4|nr:N(4)-(beta-N-acetylglucosaminyl)-L-asparaginase [Xanthovirga aplysinae]MTI31499.1 glycosylasparaginase [Xanthovirga aplysinae]
MVKNRRKFLKVSAFGVAAMSSFISLAADKEKKKKGKKVTKPIVISTWNHGLAANAEAWKILSKNGRAIDAVEKGVMVAEADPKVRSVGYGGYPDRDGNVTLDACIMDENSDCGSVACLQNIKHPIAVARKVMDETPHVMLVGNGAYYFAREKGFPHEDLLTAGSIRDWKNWLKEAKYKPVVNMENHDTIGMLALDAEGNMSGSCTTSGAAWKLHGRVGDSPIIGAGLFLDNEVGAVCATGLGEAVIRTAASTVAVELMRQGYSPLEACKEAIQRIISKHRNHPDRDHLQVGLLALNKLGEYGGFSIRPGFNFAVCDAIQNNRLEDASYEIK